MARVDPSPPFADEVRQALREKLVLGGKLAGFTGRGALDAWMRAAAVRTALSLKRGNGALASPSRAEQFPAGTDPELRFVKEKYRAECARAFQAALAALEPRQRTVLRLHHLEGMSLDALGRVYQVHRATAARWLADARDLLHETTRRELAKLLGGASKATVDSLLGLMQSQLPVNLKTLV